MKEVLIKMKKVCAYIYYDLFQHTWEFNQLNDVKIKLLEMMENKFLRF